MRRRTSRARSRPSAPGTGDDLSRGKVVELGQAGIEPADFGVVVAEDLRSIRLKLRQLPIKLDVPMRLSHMIYVNYTAISAFPSNTAGVAGRARTKPRFGRLSACPTCRLEGPGRWCNALHAQIAYQLAAMVGGVHVGAPEEIPP